MQPPPAGKRSELALSFKVLIPAALMFLLFIYFSYFVVLPLVENKMMEQRRQMLRSMGNAVWHLLDSYRQKADSGEMTADSARSMALSTVKTFRFGAEGNDYCWISDLETVVLMHPYQPDWVGRRLAEHPDASTSRAFTKSIDLVKASGEGFVDYQWQWPDDPSRIGPKLSYVKGYEPWGWMLGTGLYVDDVHAEVSFLTRQLFALLLAVLIVSTVFCLYVYQQASAIDRQRQRAEGINRVLIQISNATNTTFDLDALYRSIHLSLGEIIDVSNFFIALYDRKTDAISFPYYRDEVDKIYPMIGNIHRSGSLTAKVIRTAETVLSSREGILEWAASQGEPPVGTPAALWLGVPLKIKNEVIGVMVTQSYTDPHHFDETDVGVFVSVSDQVAMAIERKTYEMQLKEARDALEARVRRRTNALVKINLRLENEIRKQEQTENILRESEARLLQSERLAATGQLAASIAHEINSPLQGVTSLLNVMRREFGGDNQLAENLELIQGAFTSISKTVRNLLDLNRPGKEKNQPMHIHEVIAQTAALVKGYLKDNDVRLELDLPSDLPVIMGSPQELSQVFMNLITNSVESLNADPTYADRRITIRALTSGSQVVVQFTDTGIGISAEDMSRVFDAFFTSKKTMGMGVGLSICHRIIEGHNGTIEVRNRPDRGAAFTIRLPANNLST